MNTQKLDFSHPTGEAFPAIETTVASNADVQLGTVRFLSGQRAPETGDTAHDEREISMILEGELEVVSGGVTHRVGPGDLLDIPPGESHHTTALSDTRVLYLLLG